MEEKEPMTLFRKKTMDRIASPEQLTDYLHVTNPGVWVILTAIILLMAGLFAWSVVGTLETMVDARAIVKDHTAQIVASGSEEIEAGMPLHIASQDYVIASTAQDQYGRTVAIAEVLLPDGIYDAEIVTEQMRPVDFLLESR